MQIWAKVKADGSLVAGAGVSQVSKFGQGRYNITTEENIDGCSLIGTVNSPDGPDDVGPGSASILVGAVDANTLFVRTATPSGAPPTHVDDDRPFSIAIFGNA